MFTAIYLYGLLIHAFAFAMHSADKKPNLDKAQRRGRILHAIGWPIVTPAFLIVLMIEGY